MPERAPEKLTVEQRIEAFERKGPFERLGLQEGAIDSEIKAARNRIMRKFHPDAGAQDTPFNRAVVSMVNEAYEYLSGKKQLTARDPRDRSPLYTWEKYTRSGAGTRSTRTPSESQGDDISDLFSDIFRELRRRQQWATRDRGGTDSLSQMFRDRTPKFRNDESTDVGRDPVAEGAKRQVIYGASRFKSYVQSKAESGELQSLLNNPQIIEAVRARSCIEAQYGVTHYDAWMREWAGIGFDREKVDLSQELFAEITRAAIASVKYGPDGFDRDVTAWNSIIPDVKARIFSDATFVAEVKAQVIAESRYGNLLRDSLINRWKDLGLDTTALGI